MILFVCHGNVARSQFAEALLRKAGVTDVASSGTHVSEVREGNRLIDDGPAAVRIVEYFQSITGLDIATKTRNLVTPEMVEAANSIFVLTDPSDLPSYFDQCTGKTMFWKIADPHHMDFQGCRKVVTSIESHIADLMAHQPTA